MRLFGEPGTTYIVIGGHVVAGVFRLFKICCCLGAEHWALTFGPTWQFIGVH